MPKVNLSSKNFSKDDMVTLLKDPGVRKYLRETSPSVLGTSDKYGRRYDLTWNMAITFNDGTVGNLVIHMHEDYDDPSYLAGGGAWVDGVKTDHGVNVGDLSGIMRICTKILNDRYEENWKSV